MYPRVAERFGGLGAATAQFGEHISDLSFQLAPTDHFHSLQPTAKRALRMSPTLRRHWLRTTKEVKRHVCALFHPWRSPPPGRPPRPRPWPALKGRIGLGNHGYVLGHDRGWRGPSPLRVQRYLPPEVPRGRSCRAAHPMAKAPQAAKMSPGPRA